MNTLGGGDVTWLLSNEVRRQQVLQYLYPSEEEMENGNLRITFLGYFWNDWSLIDNGNFSALRGLDVRREKPWEIGDPAGVTSLDENWVTLNQMIKYLKFGFGRVTDYINEDIRNGRMTREQGIALAEKYDGRCADHYIESFSHYIGISVAEFWEQVESSVNPVLFETVGRNCYRPKFKVGIGL